MDSLALALIVFAATMIITKSRILACKREYVEKRYQSSKVNKNTPLAIKWCHKIWHAIWTCPMCSGAWCSFVICIIWGVHGYVADIAISFSINWLLHLLENLLFGLGEYLDPSKENSEKSEESLVG